WIPPRTHLDTLKLRAIVNVKGMDVAITAAHPMPPISADYAQIRDRSLNEEGALLAQGRVAGILVGDFNDTPWSWGVRGGQPLTRATSLAPTWPNAWGWLSLLPLDHILVTPNVQVLQAAQGVDLHSDHRPVVVRLALPQH